MERYFKNITKAFEEDEAKYESDVLNAAKRICEKQTVKMVFVTGASCAGKTPTTERLAHYLAGLGKKTELISLDDFYRNPDDAVYDIDGLPDYECPESLDLDLLHQCFSALCDGRGAMMPKFSFSERKRNDEYTYMSLEDDEICIVEGLHALNPKVCGSYIHPSKTFKIYLDAVSEFDDEPRLLRRIVRDYYRRNASVEETLSMWEKVENGTQKYIYPYKDTADAFINTYIAYERFVMRDDALIMLSTVPKNSRWRAEADRIVAKLSALPSLPKQKISPVSLMREFVTQED